MSHPQFNFASIEKFGRTHRSVRGEKDRTNKTVPDGLIILVLHILLPHNQAVVPKLAIVNTVEVSEKELVLVQTSDDTEEEFHVSCLVRPRNSKGVSNSSWRDLCDTRHRYLCKCLNCMKLENSY
jgi:hypothetical protein